MPHTIHPVVVALEALTSELAAGQLSSQDVVDLPQGMTLTTASQEIVAPVANQARIVIFGNLDNTKAAFLAIDHDAVAEAGIVVSVGDRLPIPLGPGRSLNGITDLATAKVAWQSFGITMEL